MAPIANRLMPCFERHAVRCVGLAADVCVKFTVLDALAEGFATTLVTEATKRVDMALGDTQEVMTALRNAGAQMIDSETLIIARK